VNQVEWYNFQMQNALVLVPKTGTTFLTNWQCQIYPGQNKETKDLTPRMRHIPVSRMYKLAGHKNLNILSIARDPYDQSCSMYFFIKRNLEDFLNASGLPDSPELRKIGAKRSGIQFGNENFSILVEKTLCDNLSLEEFLEARIRNFFYPFYYDELTPKDFYCVGITEQMEKTIKLFDKKMGEKINRSFANDNPNKDIGEPYESGYSRKDFMNQNMKEYELYYEAKKRFEELCLEENII